MKQIRRLNIQSFIIFKRSGKQAKKRKKILDFTKDRKKGLKAVLMRNLFFFTIEFSIFDMIL